MQAEWAWEGGQDLSYATVVESAPFLGPIHPSSALSPPNSSLPLPHHCLVPPFPTPPISPVCIFALASILATHAGTLWPSCWCLGSTLLNALPEYTLRLLFSSQHWWNMCSTSTKEPQRIYCKSASKKLR